MTRLGGLFGHPHADLILDWFDVSGYRVANPDVEATAPSWARHETAEYHFVHTGYGERRVYCPQLLRGFDDAYYRRQLPDEGRGQTSGELRRHWLYEGVFEGKAPNEPTDAALASHVHLFNMGRVASHSLDQVLIERGLVNVVHTHSNHEFVDAYQGCSLTYRQLVMVKALECGRPAVLFVSGVRDPVDWAVSSVARSAQFGETSLPGRPEDLVEAVRRWIGYGLSWFRHRYHQGIDVYAHPFDPLEGLAVIDSGRTRVVLYRVDKLDHLGQQLGRLLGVGPFTVPRVNERHPPGSPDALTLLRELRFPGDLWEAVRRSPYVRHFFADEEVRQMEERWLAGNRRGRS
jgi:hypothetical protein